MTRAARWWYASLLRFYPADFRRGFGDDVLRLIGDQIHGARRVDLLRCHLSATLDLVTALAQQRGVDLFRAAGWLLVGLATANIGYDVAMPKLAMGVFAWALTLIALVSGMLLSGHSPARRV